MTKIGGTLRNISKTRQKSKKCTDDKKTESPSFNVMSQIARCLKKDWARAICFSSRFPPREVELCLKRMKPYASRPHEVCALPTRIGSVAYARNHAGIHAEKESFKKIENTRRSTTRCVYCTKHVNRNRGRCSHTRLYVSDTLHKSLEWLKWSWWKEKKWKRYLRL